MADKDESTSDAVTIDTNPGNVFVFSNYLPFFGASFFSSDGHVLFVRQQGIRKKSCFSSR
jgi:hypothetical protein